MQITQQSAEHSLCYDKWAELIKSLKTHTPQQSVSRPTNVLSTTHNVTTSLSRDNVSIKTQNTRISSDFVVQFLPILPPSVREVLLATSKEIMKGNLEL